MSSVVQGHANFTPVIVGKAMVGNAKGINICPEWFAVVRYSAVTTTTPAVGHHQPVASSPSQNQQNNGVSQTGGRCQQTPIDQTSTYGTPQRQH